MNYAKIENGVVAKYPYSFNDLKKDNPQTSFPNTYLSHAARNGEYNVVEVADVVAPVKEGWTAEEEAISFDGSVWTQNWRLVSDPVDDNPVPLSWWAERLVAYGEAIEQIEFITENGLDAWQSKVLEIKAKYPKEPPQS